MAGKEFISQEIPFVVSRNHLVEVALNEALGGDLSAFQRLKERLAGPYSPKVGDQAFQSMPQGFDTTCQTSCGTSHRAFHRYGIPVSIQVPIEKISSRRTSVCRSMVLG